MFRQLSRIRTSALSAAVVLFASGASADAPVIVLHEDLAWRAIGNSGMEMAVLTGDPTQAGPYSVMLKVPKGALLHLDALSSAWRHSTIISGTLAWITGNSFEEGSMTALPPGSFWTVPSDANQRGWAWDGDVLAVVTAMGPSGMAALDGN